MSRSGYIDDQYDWGTIRWRGQVASAIRGKRGQAMMIAIVNALDALPEKKLVAESLVCDGGYCTLGAVGVSQGMDIAALDPEDMETVASKFDVAEQLAREIVWMNDEGAWSDETPEHRWVRMRAWAASKVNFVFEVDIAA